MALNIMGCCMCAKKKPKTSGTSSKHGPEPRKKTGEGLQPQREGAANSPPTSKSVPVSSKPLSKQSPLQPPTNLKPTDFAIELHPIPNSYVPSIFPELEIRVTDVVGELIAIVKIDPEAATSTLYSRVRSEIPDVKKHNFTLRVKGKLLEEGKMKLLEEGKMKLLEEGKMKLREFEVVEDAEVVLFHTPKEAEK